MSSSLPLPTPFWNNNINNISPGILNGIFSPIRWDKYEFPKFYTLLHLMRAVFKSTSCGRSLPQWYTLYCLSLRSPLHTWYQDRLQTAGCIRQPTFCIWRKNIKSAVTSLAKIDLNKWKLLKQMVLPVSDSYLFKYRRTRVSFPVVRNRGSPVDGMWEKARVRIFLECSTSDIFWK